MFINQAFASSPVEKFKPEEKGKTANIHYKVCDAGYYYIKDINGNDVLEKIGYVPDILSPTCMFLMLAT